MRPTKIKNLTDRYEQQTGIPSEDVRLMVERMFAGLKKKMIELRAPVIYEDGFGKFFFKFWKLPKLINDQEKKIYFGKGIPYIEKYNQDQYEKFLKMKKMMYENKGDYLNRYKKDDAGEKLHIPSERNYNYNGCRCEGCKKIRSEKKRTREKIAALKANIKKKNNDTKGEITKGMGE